MLPAIQPDRLNVSVIVRTCGRSPVFLRRALGSITSQTRLPAQIIVADDGEDAAGVEAVLGGMDLRGVALRHLPRDVRIQAQPNRSAALNRGIAGADTRWIAFLDDDDTWAPTFIEEMTAAAGAQGARPDIGGIICRTEAVYERVEGRVVTPCGCEPFNPGLEQVNPETLFQQNRFTINAALWLHSIFEAVKGFSEDLPVLEDWEFNMRAALHCQLAVLPRMLARYHLRPRSDPLPNTQMREHGRIAAQLQREWYRSGMLGGRGHAGHWRQMAWMAGAMISRGRARFGAWRRWRMR